MSALVQRIALIVTTIFLTLAPLDADSPKSARDLADASLEDLMNIEVTTVSKKEQKLSQAAAAVYVITQEDIRRSGMTSIPDLLRMVPGLDVAQIQGGAWAVTARGFNNEYANKLLVMVDGRSVYSPMDGGVPWEEQDTLLEDIDRIEVIRGPGATLWGANAVNGIINIITKTAKDTQGALATAGGGDQGQALGAFRYGGQLGDNGYYRAFVKDLHGRGLTDSAGRPDIGGESSVTAGFRADVKLSADDSLTVEAGALRDHADSQITSFVLQAPFAIISQGVERNKARTWLRAGPIASPTAQPRACGSRLTTPGPPSRVSPGPIPISISNSSISSTFPNRTAWCGDWDSATRLAIAPAPLPHRRRSPIGITSYIATSSRMRSH